MRLAQHKQNRDEVGVGELVTVEGDALKDLPLLWREHKPAGAKSQGSAEEAQTCAEKSRMQGRGPSPVQQTEEEVDPAERQQLLVHQPVDASLPPEEQLGESTKAGVGHLESVGHRHLTRHTMPVRD